MKKIFAVCLFSFLLSSFSQVAAQNEGDRPFVQMDTNKDGKLSRDEYMTYQMDKAKKIAELKFNKTDINSDGELSQDEISEALRKFKEAIEKRRRK
jgi:Ca2+-binding EF-hand superfamily protein